MIIPWANFLYHDAAKNNFDTHFAIIHKLWIYIYHCHSLSVYLVTYTWFLLIVTNSIQYFMNGGIFGKRYLAFVALKIDCLTDDHTAGVDESKDSII